MTIKTTKEDNLCECGHYESEHGVFGNCYKTTTRIERKRNPRKYGKYTRIRCNYQCCCKEFRAGDKK